MKKMNKILSVMMAAAMTVSMTACGGDTASDNTSASADNSAAATESAAAGSTDGQKYTIGILQQLEHPALDARSRSLELLSQIMQLPLRSTTGQVLPEEISPELPILLL